MKRFIVVRKMTRSVDSFVLLPKQPLLLELHSHSFSLSVQLLRSGTLAEDTVVAVGLHKKTRRRLGCLFLIITSVME